MEKFRALSSQSVSDNEKRISKYWNEIHILDKSIETREDGKPFIFYEGPPTANGRPGIHHVIARTLKDSVCRYRTMKGYQVRRKAGWDTHGLPVEIEVEKKLGLHNKRDIEEYGISAFNQKCRESVFEYESLWREMTERMGYEIDVDHPYITLDNNYIETVWWILDRFNKEGLIYEGHKILPYCPRCGTGLASHEVAQGYEEIKITTVYVKFKRKDADEYFLVWTTTPWTLASNAALTVHPDATYQRVRFEGTVYYIEKHLAPRVLGGEYEVLDERKGKDLEYMEYEQLMPFVSTDKKAFYVTVADYVTTEDGTGIVHTAPAFGEDDYQTGRRYGLPVLQPVDDSGKYTCTPWKGMFVMDADREVIQWLAENGKLFRKQKMVHNYPHCWRCHTPLLYYAKPSWYIEMTKLRDQLIKNNNGVDWYPAFVGKKRFGNWLENLNDWAISRSRYWGTPLNIWRCECGNTTSVGSRRELAERAVDDIDESIDLHRPYVDDVHLVCDKCGKAMTRVKDVIDCWFDSGSMPFAQQHYPFEHKEDFNQLFPADFICEGIDQTRGWFYSLLAISTFITGKAPYKAVLVNDLILDKEGSKMSKSRGNTVDPFDLFDKYGADTLRWYLLYVSPPWTPTRFDLDGLREVQSKFFGTIKNVYNFFTLYANTDGVDPREFFVPYEQRPEMDHWILSRFNSLQASVEADLEKYDMTRAIRRMQDFVNEDLSNWFIRRSRRRFWASELTQDKKAVYNTTYEVLVNFAQMIAPFAPFLSEEIYRNLTGELSVHLSRYPTADPEQIDPDLEETMDLVRSLVALGRASRESARIKVRQPIQEILVDGKYESRIAHLVPLIREELNVKEVVFAKDLKEYMDFRMKPNFKVAGPVLGGRIRLLAKALAAMDACDVAPRLEEGETMTVVLDGEDYPISKENVQITISAKKGFNIAAENNLFVVLDTTLTPDLIDEGLARELVSKVQQMRKNNGYEVMDHIRIMLNADDAVQKAVEGHRKFIMKETLALEMEWAKDFSPEKFNLNGHTTGIRIEKRIG